MKDIYGFKLQTSLKSFPSEKKTLSHIYPVGSRWDMWPPSQVAVYHWNRQGAPSGFSGIFGTGHLPMENAIVSSARSGCFKEIIWNYTMVFFRKVGKLERCAFFWFLVVFFWVVRRVEISSSNLWKFRSQVLDEYEVSYFLQTVLCLVRVANKPIF